MYILVSIFIHIFGSDDVRKPFTVDKYVHRASTTHIALGGSVSWIQAFAVLEVLHILLGWVKAPLSATVLQFLGRMINIWVISGTFAQVRICFWSPLTFSIE